MPRALSRRLFLFACAAVAMLSLPARAQPVSAGDTQAIRSVIEGQLEAFAADDAKRAFGFAAPSIREMFGTPDRFMTMVKTGYPVVARPASVSFLAPLRVQGQLVQGVHLSDAAGALWIAIYRLERQPDKSWRISGCEVQPSSGKMT